VKVLPEVPQEAAALGLGILHVGWSCIKRYWVMKTKVSREGMANNRNMLGTVVINDIFSFNLAATLK
jgi:hypothetical protein